MSNISKEKRNITELSTKWASVQITIGMAIFILSFFVNAFNRGNFGFFLGFYIILSGMTIFGFGMFLGLMEQNYFDEEKISE